MLNYLKDKLRYTPIHYTWWRVKQWAQYLLWNLKGRPGPIPPQLHKMRTLKQLAQHYKLNTVVETGTLYGEPPAYLAPTGATIYTIELADHFHTMALKRFANKPNVKCLKGDSGDVLPNLLPTLQNPTLFWLDGHFSAADTAKGIEDTPVAREIAAITQHPPRP